MHIVTLLCCVICAHSRTALQHCTWQFAATAPFWGDTSDTGVYVHFVHCQCSQQERHDFTGFEGVSQAPAAAQQQQHPQLQHHHHQQQQQHGHEQQQPHHFQHQQQQNQYMQQLQHEPQLPTSGQLQQQQQQQRVSGGHPMSRPGTVTYVDRLRAMCKALGIGNAGDHVSDEAMAAAVLAVQRGTAFK